MSQICLEEAIHQCAEAENIGLGAAAFKVAQDISFYRQFGGVRKVIEQVQQQLAQVRMFSMIPVQTQEAIAMLRTLQGLGVSLDEIYSLTKILDLPKMAAAALRQQQQNNGQQQNGGNDSNNTGSGYHNNGSSNRMNEFNLDSKLCT